MNRYSPLILTLILGLFACQDGNVIDIYEEFDDNTWSYDESVDFDFEIDDTTVYYQWFVNLRITSDYVYNNFFMKLILTGPDSSTTEEVIELTLAEKSGKWLGSGMGNALTYQLPVSNKKVYKQLGLYSVKLEQHMRIEEIDHVLAAGIKLIKQEEIF